jgi:hypothetical protein
MQEGESKATLKKLGHFGTDIEGVMPGVPRLQGRSGHLKPLGGLTLRDALRVQGERVLEQLGPLEAVPELMAIEIVVVRKIDYSAHRGLSRKPSPNAHDDDG